MRTYNFENQAVTPSWRPYKAKNIPSRLIKALITATAGFALSINNNITVLGSICSLVALGEIYKVWINNKKDKDHQKLLDNIAVFAADIYKGKAPLNVKKGYALACMSSSDVQADFGKALSKGKLSSVKNRDNITEHHLRWTISEQIESKLVIATFIACIKTALNAAAKNHPECTATIMYERLDGRDKCELKISSSTKETQTDYVLMKFAYYINFLFNNEEIFKDFKFNQSKTPLEAPRKEYIIDGPGEWLLENGNILEIVQNDKNKKILDVSVYVPQTNTRGMVIPHNSLESVNKTWGPLLALYSQEQSPAM